MMKKLLAELGVCFAGLASAYAGVDGSTPYMRIDLRHPGVYRISGHELEAAGANLAMLSPGALSLTCAGNPVPILLTGAADGKIDQNDSIEFIGESPRGTATWFMPDNKSNVYLLTWNGAGGPQYLSQPSPAGDAHQTQHFWQWQHLEKNYQFWFSTLPPDQTDNFYWFPFFAGTAPEQALKTNLSFPGFERSLGIPARVDLNLLGATSAAGLTPSHKFSFLYDMKPTGAFQFDGISLHKVRLQIPAERINQNPARISFEAPEDRRDAIDKIYLDWINVSYPSRFDGGGFEFYRFNNDLLATMASTASLTIKGLPEAATIFDPVGLAAWKLAPKQTHATIINNETLTTFTAAAPFARMRVDALELAMPAPLPSQLPPALQALVVYHPNVKLTAETYTRYRRESGWNIEAVSVRSIFDQVNNGFIKDDALKQYLAQAKQHAPSLSHIILIGDAYFDYREARSQTLSEQLDVLIPIHWVYRPGVAWSGGYQDDNWYGSFSNDFRPDVAVGRLPVNNDAEGMEYLRKIIDYESLRQSADDGAILISSVEKSFQAYVREVGEAYGDSLTSVSYLFPHTQTAATEVLNLRDQFNAGAQLIYYVGHGGSMVWRVGPEDFAQQKDLFTPADVRQLVNRGHYPVVVAASCYTTAFDQPESIGETLVKQPNAGAIAVIGSPWKAAVQDSHEFNRHLFRHYFDPTVKTLGEASLRAHKDYIPVNQSTSIENSFTLLGDPCLKISRKSDGETSKVSTASAVYHLNQDRVVLNDYDDVLVAAPLSRLTLTASDFPGGKAYRNQLLLPAGAIKSKDFKLPVGTTTVTLLASGRAAGDIFPRVRVSLTAGKTTYKLFEGYWQTSVLEAYDFPVPDKLPGTLISIKVEMLNPGVVEEERLLYLQELNFL